MNPVSLDAIKLLMDLSALTDKESEKLRYAKVIEQLLFIMEKDVEQAFQKYSTVKLM